jgi:hypothetical protein
MKAAHRNLPALSDRFVNLLFENIRDERLQFRAVFHSPTRDFLGYFNAAFQYNLLHRQSIAGELDDILSHSPELSFSAEKDRYLTLLLTLQEIYGIKRSDLDELLGWANLTKRPSPNDEQWEDQNHPIHVMSPQGYIDTCIPLMARFFCLDEETIYDQLDSPESYGWGDSLINHLAWANNAYKIVYITPGKRYGSIPDWFPTTDQQDRAITEQAQVDRFLLLVDSAYGGFVGDHIEVEPYQVARGILELREDWGTYIELEAGIEWELAEEDS